MASVGGQVPNFTEPLEDSANVEQGEITEADADSILSDQFLTGAASEDMGEPEDEAVDLEDEEVDEELEDEEEVEEEELEEVEAKPEGKANKRIRKLAAERKAAQERATAVEQQAQQQLYIMQQQAQAQMEQQKQLYEAQLNEARKVQELMSSKAEREAEKSLSPMEQYELKIKRESLEAARAELMPEVDAVKNMLKEQREAQEAAQADIQRRARYEYYTKSAEAGASELLDGMDGRSTKGMGREMQEMLLAYSAGVGLEPAQALPRFKQFLGRYTQGDLQRRTTTRGKRVVKNSGQPVQAKPGRTPAKGNKLPSLEQLQANGYDDHISWMTRGEPALDPIPKE